MGFQAREAFQHEAFFYAGENEFLEGTASFMRAGVERGEPALAVVATPKIDALRSELGDHADGVEFADVKEVGSNPARMMPAWREFADRHPERPIRGVGEPIWADRTPAELIECQRHESLLNLAFADRADFRLLCPYDTDSLSDAVLEEAHHSHPLLRTDGTHRASDSCRSLDDVAAPFAEPLPEPPGDAVSHVFQRATLSGLRRFVARHAEAAKLGARATEDLMISVTEVATNTVLYGGGGGILRIWQDDGALVCEVSDRGTIESPLAGRESPAVGSPSGYGLWLANQLCDLAQIRSFSTGSVVRLYKRPA